MPFSLPFYLKSDEKSKPFCGRAFPSHDERKLFLQIVISTGRCFASSHNKAQKAEGEFMNLSKSWRIKIHDLPLK